jgi:hypothetical protein
MHIERIVIGVLMFFLLTGGGMAQEIVISEVMSSNSTTVADGQAEYHDWIELYNASDKVINLAGYSLSDDPDNPRKWTFEDFDFPPRSFLLVWASGQDIQAGPLAPDNHPHLKTWFSAGDVVATDQQQVRLEGDTLRLTNWKSHDGSSKAWAESDDKQPVYVSNGINSHPTIRFNGTNHALKTDYNPPSGNQERAIMIVVANTQLETANQNNNNHIVHYGSLKQNEAYGIVFGRQKAGAKIGNHYWNNTFYGLFGMDNDPHIITASYDGAADFFHVDGNFAGKHFISLNTGKQYPLTLGGRIGGTHELYGGDLADVVVFDEALSPSDRQRIENFFAKRYGKSLQLAHTNFNLSAGGEALLITNKQGELLHRLEVPSLPTDVSYGLDGKNEGYFSTPTPGGANGQRELSILQSPVFSVESGFYTDEVTLKLSSPDPDALILYTLDGSTPDYTNLAGFPYRIKSDYKECNKGELTQRLSMTYVYQDSLLIKPRYGIHDSLSSIATSYSSWKVPAFPVTTATIVRARTWKPGSIPSKTETKTYLVDSASLQRYNLPVVSLVTDPYHLFDYDTGIYVPGTYYDQTCTMSTPDANYKKEDWERPISFELLSETGEPLFKQDAGVRIHGYYSTNRMRKSLRLTARKTYDEATLFNYPLFPDLKPEASTGGVGIDAYNSFLIRNSGNEWYSNLFLDAMVHRLVGHVPGMDEQASRPVVHFINGVYWGIMNLREKHSKHYFAQHYGMDPDDVIIANARTASISAGYAYEYKGYTDMEQFVGKSDLTVPLNMDYLNTLMDVGNYLNHFVVQIYINNTDFLGNNRKFWRKRTPGYMTDAPLGHDGRWRWIFYDVDQSFDDPDYNRLAYTTVNDFTSTLLLRKLLERQDLRETFITRFCDHMNTSFKPARVVALIDSMAQEMAHDLPEHIDRWGMLGDQQQIEPVKAFAVSRPYYMRQHLMALYGLTDTALVTVATDKLKGTIRVNTLLIDSLLPGLDNPDQPYPWQGSYFSGVPVVFEAIPQPGYVFSHWEGDTSSTQAVICLDPTGEVHLVAHFVPEDTLERSFLHYWHFNTRSGVMTTVPTDYSQVSGALLSYPGTGLGYMDERKHRDADPEPTMNVKIEQTVGTGAVLRVRNPSSTRQLLVASPTSCFHDIVVSYATTRTDEGATHQCFHYSIDGGLHWTILGGAYPVPQLDTARADKGYVLKRFDLSHIEGVANNQAFQWMVTFVGEGADNPSGNARFDNICVEGVPVMPTVDKPLNQKVTPGATTEAIDFSGSYTTAVYEWTNDRPDIGLPGHGQGTIQPFVAINESDSVIVATIQVTPVVNGFAGLSVSFTIAVDTLSIAPDLKDEEILVYPNPASDVVTIRFNMDEARDVDIQLIDAMGRRLLYIDKKALPVGPSSVALPVAAYSSGLYWLRVGYLGEGKNRSKARKVMIK